jgi:orotate phosphoribosyltransferase
MKEILKQLILNIFDAGGIIFGKFPFKHKENFPAAPDSPMKIELRTNEHPKGGPLSIELIHLLAKELFGLASELGIQYDCVTGIPWAGVPFAEEFARLCGKPLIELTKEEKGGQRRISGVKNNEQGRGRRILVLDDLINFGNSKRETAEVLEDAGFIIAAMLFVVDREEGGLESFRELGYKIHVLFSLTEMLKTLLWEERIDIGQYAENIRYLEEANEFHRLHK